MIALQIKSMKHFMHALLNTETFDIFLLEEATISTANTYQIDGHLNEAFYTAEEWSDAAIRPYEFSSWKEMRSLCFELIKGTRTPIGFKFVLHLCPEYIKGVFKDEDALLSLELLKALVLTIKYSNGSLTLVTGISFHSFVPTKEPEKLWDQALKRFLEKKGLEYEAL